MTQIEVWDQTVKEMEISGIDLILFWADKMSGLCEYMNTESRMKSILTLFPLLEKVSDRYSQARTHAAETKKDV